MLEFIATKYYSEKYGLKFLKHKVHVVIEANTGYKYFFDIKGKKHKSKFYINNNGYLWTSVTFSDGKKMSCRINRLVYSNIKGEIPKGFEIDHIDKNRTNNYPENLRCITRKENNQNKNIKGENNGFSKLSLEDAREICRLKVNKLMSAVDIANKFNVSKSTVKSIASGRNWKNFTEDIRKRR